MKRHLSAALLLAFAASSGAGCSSTGPGASSPGGVDLPPTLTITTPDRGSTSDGTTVTVTGHVEDDRDGARVTVNGVDAQLSSNGDFTASVPAPGGILFLETHAIDAGGHDVRDVRAVLAGQLAASDGKRASQLGAKIGAAGFMKIGGAVSALLSAMDWNTMALAQNPILDSSGCNSAKLNITTLGIGGVAVELVPAEGVLKAKVALSNVRVDVDAKFKALCIGGSTDVSLRAARATVTGDLALTVVNGQLTSAMPASAVDFEGFELNVGGIPGAIEDLVQGTVRDKVEKLLATFVKDEVPKLANDQLKDLIARSYSEDLLGHEAKIGVSVNGVSLTPAGLLAIVDTTLHIVGGEGGFFVPESGAIGPATMPGQGLGVALALDTINQLFAGAWAAGALERDLDVATLGPLAGLLAPGAAKLGIEPLLAPALVSSSAGVRLAIGDLMLSVRDASNTELQRIALSVASTLQLGPNAAGKLALTVGMPEVKAQIVKAADDGGLLTSELLEGAVNGAWGLVGGMADDALAKLPLPQIAGVQLGAPTISGINGFLVADIPLN